MNFTQYTSQMPLSPSESIASAIATVFKTEQTAALARTLNGNGKSCLEYENDLGREEKTVLDLVTASIVMLGETGDESSPRRHPQSSRYKAQDRCFLFVTFKRPSSTNAENSNANYMTAEVSLGKRFSMLVQEVCNNLLFKDIITQDELGAIRFSLVEFRNVLWKNNTHPLIVWIEAVIPAASADPMETS